MPTRSPTLLEVLDKWREGILRDIRVALPGRVVKYDAATQLADIKPEIQDFFFDEDDTTTSISVPVITNVPVQWLGGGGFHVTAPLAVGDKVTVLCHDRSLDAWLAQGGEQAPVDQRRHNLSDAVALVGLHDNQNAIPGVPTDGIAMGADGGMRVKVTAGAVELGASATQAAVSGDLLKTYLDKLVELLSTFSTGLNAGTLTARASALATALDLPLTALAVYRSATVKVQP